VPALFAVARSELLGGTAGGEWSPLAVTVAAWIQAATGTPGDSGWLETVNQHPSQHRRQAASQG
jgi:hypothetical protein